MGVPKFFRWVSDRYPTILSGPLNSSTPNVPIDHLYLDMNGIIHESARANPNVPEDLFFETILQNIFNEIRRIFDIVQPQKLLFIAVDGVAPRAKLNQQRARRFRSSKERLKSLENSLEGSSFDSNCITPGTEFMAKLTVALQAFVEHMMKTDSQWTPLKIHFSGSEVPGEGEHKIVSYIRDAKQLPDYTPNLRHCILGADADMIMLALATHEPYFLVLRDAINFNFNRTDKNSSGGRGRGRGVGARASTSDNATTGVARGKVMNYVRINVLRECIVRELLEDLDQEDFDTERILDDFVFLTFLVGNDFLPSLPAINIGDQAFDLIFDAYKTVLASDPGYLVHNGEIEVSRLELIFALIGATEKSLYYDQKLMEELKVKQAAERKAKYSRMKAERAAATGSGIQLDADNVSTNSVSVAPIPTSTTTTTSWCEKDNKTPNESLAEEMAAPTGCTTAAVAATPSDYEDEEDGGDDGVHFIHAEQDQAAGMNSVLTLPDREEACKRAYYLEKFDLDLESETEPTQKALREIIAAYLTGLRWCLKYYTTGCCSWSWYYPYHYGPFLHDMTELESVSSFSSVTLGAPLLPFQQLLACLPSASCDLLPPPYRALMCDKTSPLAHVYPTDFTTDRNGKKQEYEAVVLLPFIDTVELLAAEEAFCPAGCLTPEETARNTFGSSYVYTAQRTQPSPVTLNTEVSVRTTAYTPSFSPGECFRAELVPGTVPDKISIPGFPCKAALEEVVNYTKGYGKSKASKKNQRSRANCYGEGGGEGVDCLPAPGITSGISSGITSGSTSGICTADLQSSWPNSSPAIRGDGSICNNVAPPVQNICADIPQNQVELRLLLDTRSSLFLHVLAQQVSLQSPQFHPIEGLESSAHTCFQLVGVSPEQMRIALQQGALSKASAIYGPVTVALQPVGFLTMDGKVCIKYVDTSHLAQLEEFLCQRVFGNDLIDSILESHQPSLTATPDLPMSSSTPSTPSRPNILSSTSGCFAGLAGYGVGFSRQVQLGVYAGEDSEHFISWLNKEFYKLGSMNFPVCKCEGLLCVELLRGKEGMSEDEHQLQDEQGGDPGNDLCVVLERVNLVGLS